MLNRRTLFAAIFLLATQGAAYAGGMRPMEARNIDLGEMSGVAYYTVERDRFRVVATLAQGDEGTPLRVVTVLAPGQSVVLSAPDGAGAVEIKRQAGTVLVRRTPIGTN